MLGLTIDIFFKKARITDWHGNIRENALVVIKAAETVAATPHRESKGSEPTTKPSDVVAMEKSGEMEMAIRDEGQGRAPEKSASGIFICEYEDSLDPAFLNGSPMFNAVIFPERIRDFLKISSRGKRYDILDLEDDLISNREIRALLAA